MTIFGKHIFHKWKDIETIEKIKFMGTEYCDYKQTRYRGCEECHIIQSHTWDSHGGWWWTLPPEQQKIIKSHLFRIDDKWILDKKAGIPPKFSLVKCKDKE